MTPTFRLPTRTILAPGSLEHLVEEVNALKCTRAFLVFDNGLASTPWPERVLDLLSRCSAKVEIFDAIEPNPRASSVDLAAESARSFDADFVIAIGGGSVLDAAKAVSMLLRNEGSCANYEGKNIFQHQPVPFVAIPTTCGTGSEVTWVSVISDPDSKRKISIKGDGMFPTVALVDADLIATLPPSLIAQTGVDALTHAMEAFVSRCSNPVSDVLASRAASLLLKHLEPCVADPDQADHRTAVMKASTIAGMAFGNADVGAVHCLSESIGGLFDLPHGLLNAQFLGPVFRYQFASIESRLNTMIDGFDAESLLSHTEQMIANLSIPSVASLELPADSLAHIARLAFGNNSNDSNPKVMTSADYQQILNSAL